MEWINDTGVDFESNLDDYLGFIYKIKMKDGRFYIGRKQFWKKQGKSWIENDWRNYSSSSKNIMKDIKEVKNKTILAVFTSKSCIRYAEAAAIILTKSYYPDETGLNWSFDGCKGKLKMEGTDREQMNQLISRW